MRVLLAILLVTVTPAMKHTSADTKVAQASLVKVADFGKGWTGKASTQQGATFDCTGFHPSGAGIVETGAASSQTISYDSTGPFIAQNTSVYATAGEAHTYWQRAVTPQLSICVAGVLKALTTRGLKVTITSQGKLPLSSSLARAAAYRAVGTVASAKNKLTYYIDVIVLGQGRTITALTISSVEKPPPASFEKGLAAIIAGRLSGPGAA